MHICINFCQIFFIATCSVFPDFASRAIVRDKYKHYMKWYPVTAFLCGRAMFVKELYCDRFVKISFYCILEGIITSNLSVRCASWRLLKVHRMNTSFVQKIVFKATISGRYSKPCLLLLNHSPLTREMITSQNVFSFKACEAQTTLTDNNGTIQSPGYPCEYGGFQYCNWAIRPSGPASSILIEFHQMSLSVYHHYQFFYCR